MDFWDLTKLLGRRWRISIPMLLLTAVLTVLTFTQVKPNYVATAYVELVPSMPPAVPAGRPAQLSRNPWMNQNLTVLGNAALVAVQDLTYIDTLKATGYSDKFTAVLSDNAPLATFTVTAKSREQASATANQLVDRFASSAGALQTSYGVTKADLITSARLDDGTNVKASHSTLKRALIVVAGVGLLLTAAITVGCDAWLRRRAHVKDAEAEAAIEIAPPITPQRSRVLEAAAPATGRVLVMLANDRPSDDWTSNDGRTDDWTTNDEPGTGSLAGDGSSYDPPGADPAAHDVSSKSTQPVDESESDSDSPGCVPHGAARRLVEPDEQPTDATVVLPRAVKANEE